ncbi:hypothetical protein ABW48_05970 [Pluralibacter gergoviae]|nr:hypothetical protein ABW48_05970 [Pluralibacter gergoviae]
MKMGALLAFSAHIKLTFWLWTTKITINTAMALDLLIMEVFILTSPQISQCLTLDTGMSFWR